LTEGAIAAALLDSLAALNNGDAVSATAHQLGDRPLIAALLRAAERGVQVHLLLDPIPSPNLGAAAELMRAGRNIEVRWSTESSAVTIPMATRASVALMRHGKDASIYFGPSNFTRRTLGDFNLESAVELRLPAFAALPKAFTDYFAKRWASSAAYERYSDESSATYWSYRFGEATGLSSF
jgi:hypothetical protein